MSWALTSLVILVLVAAMRWSPRRWFLWAGGGAAALTLAGSFLYPVFVEPVFNNFESLQEGNLRSSVFALADEEGVDVERRAGRRRLPAHHDAERLRLRLR